MNAEKKKEQDEAAAELEAYFNKTRPRNLAEGLTSGVGNVLSGAVGTVGSVVLMPVVGMAAGYKKGGILGSALGLVGGAVAGVVGGVISAVGGILKGTSQIVRGVASVPKSIAGPMGGMWWNDIDGKWVETNLIKEEIALSILPEDDKDILGEKASEQVDTSEGKFHNPNVKDPFYYDTLGISSDADQATIKRQYYLLARKYHPDKVGNDLAAAEMFKSISEAYQVLADPDLRSIYDREGLNGLTADKTSAAYVENQPDPTILFAFLFGSDKFYDYVGRLAVATSALVGNDISIKDARKLQIRRCTRIAIKLAKKLEAWTNPDTDDEFVIMNWQTEARSLAEASYGHELVVLIGNVYSLSATQFLGSLDSGIGMPSITKWVKAKSAKFRENKNGTNAQINTLQAAILTMKRSKDAEIAMSAARTQGERNAIAEEMAKEHLAIMLQVMWTMTTVDITSTLHEAIQMVLFDRSIDKTTSKRRAKGIRKLGEIFMACPAVKGESDPAKIYEEAAFAAMIETVKRKEDSAFKASFRHVV